MLGVACFVGRGASRLAVSLTGGMGGLAHCGRCHHLVLSRCPPCPPAAHPARPATYESASALANAAMEAAGALRRDVMKRIRAIYGVRELMVGFGGVW